MKTLWINKVAIGVVTLALSGSVMLGAPAQANNKALSNGTSVSATSEVVRVTQQGKGSYFGLLQWPSVANATEYRIYKTGSIRPSWRLFHIAPARVTSRIVSDRPAVVAIYRLFALVNSREVFMGEVVYIPKR
jgi:hypothetical protein